jgi:hypothetical protein
MSRGIGKRKKNEWSKVKPRGGEKICELLFRERERERERERIEKYKEQR